MEGIPKTSTSRVERIVGGTAAQQAAALRSHVEDVQEALKKGFAHEREKFEVELAMLSCAEQNVNRARARYGLPAIQLPPQKLHTIDADHLRLGNAELNTAGGFEIMTQQTVVTNAEAVATEGIGRFDMIQHESLHAGQYQSLQVRDEEVGIMVDGYRTGISVKSRKPDEHGQYQTYLWPLHEAITEENSRRLVLDTETENADLKSVLQERETQFSEFIDFCESTPNHGYPEGLVLGDVIKSEINPDNGRPRVRPFAYYHERQVMWRLFEEIYERNGAAFPGKSREEAREMLFDMLTQASFDGNIMPFGRLMNETFGAGAFRAFGHLQTTEEIGAFLDTI